jgi:uncharacterized membrane protein
VGFSDGVFSIAITLLVLEIGVPSGSEKDLLRALAAEWPSYLAYLVSFATIGGVWFGHTVITQYLDHANSTFIRLNLVLLLAVSFLPFPTELVGEHIGKSPSGRHHLSQPVGDAGTALGRVALRGPRPARGGLTCQPMRT